MKRPPPWHALHYLRPGTRVVLDVGCNAGEVLQHARDLGATKLFGIDINGEAVELARDRLGRSSGAELFVGSAERLPIGDGMVETAFCLEVLEHIPSALRKSVIREIGRVLMPGGRLVFSVPYQGAFAFLDPANARLRFPGTFRLAAALLDAAAPMDAAPGTPHHHFRMDEIRELLEPDFRTCHVRWRGALLTPICNWLEWPFYRRRATGGRLMQVLQRVRQADMALAFGETVAYDVLLVAERVGSGGNPHSRPPQQGA